MSVARYRYLAINWKTGEVHAVDSISSIWHGPPIGKWYEFKIYIIS